MLEEIKSNPKLLKEYEEVFENDEKVLHTINIDSDSFSLSVGVVLFSEISFSEPLKNARKETYLGLSKSVEELGILSPIHVMVTEGYDDWVNGTHDEGEEYGGFKYVVIDGFRRVYAGVKNGLSRCNAIIWNFRDKELGNRLLTTLSLILNKDQQHSWKEKWDLSQVLEAQSSFSSTTMDFLLQMEPGDYLKLKSIMEETGYPEIREDLFSGKKTLQQCYNNLQKLLKEENASQREDKKSISEVEGAEDIVNKDADESKTLSDQEVREVLEMDYDFSGDLSEDDFKELTGAGVPDERQTPGDRHPLDPKLRTACFQRDNFSCQCSGLGVDSGLPIELAMGVLHAHHLVPVHAGGTDTLDNLVTLDLSSHTLVHIIERNDGKINMKKEDFDKLPKDKQEYIKKVLRIAKYAVDANRRLGKKKEDIVKATQSDLQFKMPGLVQKENMDALKAAV